MLKTTSELPMQLCPTCGYLFECATSMKEGRRPKEGDFSVCINCAGVMRFDADFRLVASSVLDAGPDMGRCLQIIIDGIKILHARGDRPKQSDQTESRT